MSDLLGPTGPHTSLSDHRPTAYQPEPHAPPYRLRRGPDGHVYGWVRMVPISDSDAGPNRASTVRRKPPEEEHKPVERPTAIADLPGYHQRPDPLTAHNPAEFVETMRRFRSWAGDFSYRHLEQFCGRTVPRSTLWEALASHQLPKYTVLVGFITACGGDEEEVQRWVTAWRNLRMNEAGSTTTTTVLAEVVPTG